MSFALFRSCIIVTCLLSMVGQVKATITNADFSAGLAGWASSGNVDTATSYSYGNPAGGTINPTAGTRVVEMVTGGGSNLTTLASFLGTTTGVLNAITPETATNGSAIRTSFQGTDSVTFDWNMWTRDYPPFNDFSFVTLSGPGISGTQTTLLTTVNSFAGPNGTNGPSNGTGWDTLTLTLPGEGLYTIGFGVLNARDTAVSSYFYVDNLETTCVPEPSTAFAAFFAIGLICLFPYRRRREQI